jgi:hypothetical protein
MITHVVYGCCYPRPERDIPRTPRALPSNPDNLRQWQLPDFCRRAVGIPINIEHHTTGTLINPTTGKDTIKSTGIIAGDIPLGRVVDTWINPSTGSMHWIGEVTYDPMKNDLVAECFKTLDRLNLFFGFCSLTHKTATNYSSAVPINMAITGKPLRRNAKVYWDANYMPYLRETGWYQYNQKIVMASAAPAPTPTSTPGAVAETLAATPTPMETPANALLQVEEVQQLVGNYDALSKKYEALAAYQAAQAEKKNAEVLTIMEKMWRAKNGIQQTPGEEAGTQIPSKYLSNPILIAASASVDPSTMAIFSEFGEFIKEFLQDPEIVEASAAKRTRTAPSTAVATMQKSIPNLAYNPGATAPPKCAELIAAVRERNEISARINAAGTAAARETALQYMPPQMQQQMLQQQQQMQMHSHTVNASAAAGQMPQRAATESVADRLMASMQRVNSATASSPCAGRLIGADTAMLRRPTASSF